MLWNFEDEYCSSVARYNNLYFNLRPNHLSNSSKCLYSVMILVSILEINSGFGGWGVGSSVFFGSSSFFGSSVFGISVFSSFFGSSFSLFFNSFSNSSILLCIEDTSLSISSFLSFNSFPFLSRFVSICSTCGFSSCICSPSFFSGFCSICSIFCSWIFSLFSIFLVSILSNLFLIHFCSNFFY